jgi:hypothetical protein
MFRWKRKHEGNRFEYSLVLDDDSDKSEIFGSVVVIEDDCNGDITVKAECEEIGYKDIKENVDKNFLRIMVSNMKKFIEKGFEKRD